MSIENKESCSQRDGAEHRGYVRAPRPFNRIWKENDSAGKLPESPVQADGEEDEIRLLPFGCTKLRISQFPWYQ